MGALRRTAYWMLGAAALAFGSGAGACSSDPHAFPANAGASGGGAAGAGGGGVPAGGSGGSPPGAGAGGGDLEPFAGGMAGGPNEPTAGEGGAGGAGGLPGEGGSEASVGGAGGAGGAGPVVSDPLTHLGCVMWFDMLDAASYVHVGSVTSIKNKASGVAWTEGAKPPLYAAAGINGKPAMSFTGASSMINNEAAVAAAFGSGAAYTLLAVIKTNAPDLAAAFFGVGDANTTGVRRSRDFGTNTTGSGTWLLGMVNDANLDLSVESVSSAVTDAVVFEAFHSGAAVSLSINGAAADPSAVSQAGTVTPTRSGLGVVPFDVPAGYWNGFVGELVIFKRALPVGERAELRSYLGAKWNIQVQ
jgi:hypothetical protein